MKSLIMLALCLNMSIAQAFDLNQASAFELESVRGIGQTMAEKIVIERQTYGVFKNWQDFKNRIQGVGENNLIKMQEKGLSLSQPMPQSTKE